MGALIDSSVLIEAERGRLDWLVCPCNTRSRRLRCRRLRPLSYFTACTARSGPLSEQSGKPFVEGLLATIPVLPFDLVVARVHAKLWAHLAKKGIQIGQLDSMISATALAWNLTVIACDQRSFPRVPNLHVEILNII